MNNGIVDLSIDEVVAGDINPPAVATIVYPEIENNPP